MKNLLFIVLFGTLANTVLCAQSNTNSGGAEATGINGSVSYSVGQIAYSSYSGSNGSVDEGVHHAYEISVPTEIGQAAGINLSISAFPNPTSDYLTLRIEELQLKNLSYQLYNLNGKLLKTEKISSKETIIGMASFDTSTYFVKIIKGNQEVKSFKIIKN